MPTHKIVIRPDATMLFVYSDDLRFLVDQAETCKQTRVSHVSLNADGLWVADMAPVQGPTSPPFRLYKEAVQWEIDWLNENIVT